MPRHPISKSLLFSLKRPINVQPSPKSCYPISLGPTLSLVCLGTCNPLCFVHWQSVLTPVCADLYLPSFLFNFSFGLFYFSFSPFTSLDHPLFTRIFGLGPGPGTKHTRTRHGRLTRYVLSVILYLAVSYSPWLSRSSTERSALHLTPQYFLCAYNILRSLASRKACFKDLNRWLHHRLADHHQSLLNHTSFPSLFLFVLVRAVRSSFPSRC